MQASIGQIQDCWVFTLINNSGQPNLNANGFTYSYFVVLVQVSGIDVGWTLGFMIKESSEASVMIPEEPMNTVLFVLLVILFVAFIIIAFLFAVKGRRHYRIQRHYSPISSYGSVQSCYTLAPLRLIWKRLIKHHSVSPLFDFRILNLLSFVTNHFSFLIFSNTVVY